MNLSFLLKDICLHLTADVFAKSAKLNRWEHSSELQVFYESSRMGFSTISTSSFLQPLSSQRRKKKHSFVHVLPLRPSARRVPSPDFLSRNFFTFPLILHVTLPLFPLPLALLLSWVLTGMGMAEEISGTGEVTAIEPVHGDLRELLYLAWERAHGARSGQVTRFLASSGLGVCPPTC